MTDQARNRILDGCYSFLIPVARFLLHRGISYREFEHLARTAFVEAASGEFGIRGRPTNASRVSAMTGIPRKDIRRIRENTTEYGSTVRSDLSPLGDILHGWYTNPEFLDAQGKPIAVPLEGKAPSLEALVRRSAGDLPLGAVKVELLRIEAVTQHQDGTFSPTRRHAVPILPDDKLIASVSFSLFGLASTIAYNTDPERDGPGRIERFVQSDPISEENKKKMYSVIRKRIIEFTEEIDDTFSDVESDQGKSDKRIGVGVYYFEDD